MWSNKQNFEASEESWACDDTTDSYWLEDGVCDLGE